MRQTIEAESLQEAERSLLSRQIPVLHIERVLRKGEKRTKATNISLKQKVAFANQMKSAMRIDLGLLRAIGLCREQAVQKRFVPVLNHMYSAVQDGRPLYEAMRGANAFDPLVLGLIKAGEGTGHLDEAFVMVAYIYKRASIISRKIKKLMMMPAITIIVAAICVFFLMWKTIPQFVGLFAGMGAELPMPTKILMNISNFVASYPWLVALVLIVAFVFFSKLGRIYQALPSIHGFLLKIPIVGTFQKKIIQETFMRTYLSMVRAGDVPVLHALGLCRGISPCYPYKSSIARAMVSVSMGGSLSSALEPDIDIFGLLLVRSLAFGDETGRTSEILEPLAEELGEEVMDFIDNMNTVIQPIITLFIAGVVLLIMLALFVPIFSLVDIV